MYCTLLLLLLLVWSCSIICFQKKKLNILIPSRSTIYTCTISVLQEKIYQIYQRSIVKCSQKQALATYHSLSQKKYCKKTDTLFWSIVQVDTASIPEGKIQRQMYKNRFRQCIISRKNITRKPDAPILSSHLPLQTAKNETDRPSFFYKTHSYLADDTRTTARSGPKRVNKFQCTRTGIHLRNAFFSAALSSRENAVFLSKERSVELEAIGLTSLPFFSAIHWSDVALRTR